MELHKRLFGKNTLDRKSLIEISGPSNSGKSLLAQQLMGYYLCALNWDILFVNLSHKVQAHNFAKIIKSHGSISTEEDLEKRLQSVKLMNCFSPKEFDEALNIMKYMLRANLNIKLVVFDTISEFFWLETEQRTPKISKLKYYNKYVQCVETICASTSKIQHKLHLTALPEGGILLNGQPVEFNSKGVHFIDKESSKETESG